MTRRSRLLLAACAAAIVLLPMSSEAQARRRSGVATRATIIVGSPYYYGPFWYDPWYPYWSWYQGPYYGGYYSGSASLRLQVTPRQAEVFVDGYYAGIVDDFDGTFQRLNLEPGEHEVQLFLPGYRLFTQRIYLQPRGTFRLRQTLEPLQPGDSAPVRPSGAPLPPRRAGSGTPAPAATGPRPPAAATVSTDYGTAAFRVQPADAEIFVDGERWEGPTGDARLLVQLAAGAHRIEIRKDGYRTYTSELSIRAGETVPVNVSLARGQ